ncbi:MAG: LysM peptidoglycan-binding domain-containing protein [Elusimicrobia bacterium]|nr:LysM peptidoglycan-binding domain-containing protein [Elusimicrobiota bacterium]
MRRTIVVAALTVGWTLAAVSWAPAPQAQAPAAHSFKRSGVVTDAGGQPLTGTFLLDFRLRDPADLGEVWRESIYVSAVDGVFHAELGRIRPLPPTKSITQDMVEVSAPAESGWAVRPLEARPARPAVDRAERRTTRAPAANAIPEGPPGRSASGLDRAPEDQAVIKLQKELQKAKAEIEAQKSSMRPGIYEVQPGDTLRSIAEKVFGNPEQWVDIYQANDDRLLRGGDLVPGQKLIIPRDVPGSSRRKPE